jgi:preprotein translocase subunit YajC
MNLISPAFAQAEQTPPATAPAAPQTTPPAAAPGQSGGSQTGVAHPGSEPAPTSLPDLLSQIVPILIIMAIVYVIVIRPQQRQAKAQKDLLKNVRRGDTIVTAGGFVAKVTKTIDDAEIEAELSPNVRVRLLRSAITEVRARGEPVKDQSATAKN